MMKQRYGKTVIGFLSGVLLLTGCQSKSYQPVELVHQEVQTVGTVAAEAAAKDSRIQEAESSESETAQVETSAVNAERKTEPSIVFEEITGEVYVSGDKVNIRGSASLAGEILGQVSRGTKLTQTGYSENWVRVEYNGKSCYISTKYLVCSMPEDWVPAEAGGTAASGSGEVKLNTSWKYAEFSKINSGLATLYRSEAENSKGITICVNAGHGTSGGSSVSTLCHPDGTPKVTGGTTSAGATTAAAVSGGMTFSDGTPEAKVTLAMAKVLKEKLLARGYDVLMIRESDDVQLDNIARTVIANNMADCHIALHWDSTATDKGAFYMSVPNVTSYRNMEPVASNWQKHNALGEKLISGLKGAGVKIWSGGALEADLTQTSYSTVPSIDIELGDKASDHSSATLEILAKGLADGIDQYFANR